MTDHGGPLFPGGVGVSALRVYPWSTPDGLRGGTPHMHLVCTEGYLVIEGSGVVQTITASGYEEIPLRPGDVVSFSPGTIHRLVNSDGRLRLNVVMQNDGLPEAGDAVLTYPPERLVDRDTYDAVTSLVDPTTGEVDDNRARARRDLAIEGFTQLRQAARDADPAPLREFHAAANRLVSGRLDEWRRRWSATALRAAQLTGEQIDALARGDHGYLRSARTQRTAQPDQTVLGMCGFLSPYQIR
jgi:mannose-6-phosphate isomerase-like protein (cupin superfamily)